MDGDGTTIDGTTQTANRGDTNSLGPEIELDGSLAGEDGYGIDIRSSNNLVRGLIINRFAQDGVRIAFREVSGNRVVGNYIGTDARGQAGLGNRGGVTVDSGPHDNFIGGEAPGDGNVISGNRDLGGIHVYRANSNRIIGNYIGTDAAGGGALGNDEAGVSIAGGSQGNVVGPANRVAHNPTGIRVGQGGTTGNTITRNAITSNDVGIWLSDGGNNELASPIITTVSATQVSGTACPGCRVEVFSDPEDEGAVYEGSTTVDGAGNWTFSKPDGLAGPNVTATATDGAGNTSEFSLPVRIAGTATPTPTSTPTGTPSPTPTASATPTPTPTATVGAPPALIVNTTDDADDGTCDAGHCSLREAVWLARPGDTIAFNIPPSDPGYDATVGVWTVRPAARYGLPGGVTIDGTTQTANRGDTNPFGPEIEVDGSGHTSDFDCFRLRSDGNVLRGLAINRCGSTGVWVEGSRNVVAGNYIGTDPTGTQALPVTRNGVLVIRAQNNTIGGTAPADRNVIVGNASWSGIRIADAISQGNQVRGNYIGTDRTGTLALGNGSTGIMIHANAHDNLIGPGNVISGNRWGVWILEGANGNTVRDNYVGTDGRGAAPLANAGLGVALNAQGNTIGPGNVIAYNQRPGVWVENADSVGNTITRNSIHSNGGLGINNVDGGNLELAPPVIAMISGGRMSGTACPDCTVEVFSDFEDQGRTFEGATVADAAGNWSLDVSPAGPNVTSTATDGAGNTSEFSAPAAVWRSRVYLPLVMR